MREAFRGGWPFRHPPNMNFELNTRSPQADGLVAWWPTLGSRGAGRLRDFSSRGNDGTLVTPTWVQTGEKGAVLDYTADYVTVPDSDSLDCTSELSICAWLYADSWADTNTIVKKDGNYIFRAFNGVWQLFYWNGAANRRQQLVGLNTPSAGAWHHVILTIYGNDLYKLYQDGVASILAPGSVGSARDLTNVLTIGDQVAGGEGFDGKFGDIRFYRSPLSDAKAYELYANPWELYAPRVRFWPGFADGCVTTVTVTETTTVTVVAQV